MFEQFINKNIIIRFIEFDSVSIYSVSVNSETVNVSVSNISVLIPRDITNRNDNRNDKITQLFDSIDILVVDMNTSANVSTIISENSNNVEGELSENSISIENNKEKRIYFNICNIKICFSHVHKISENQSFRKDDNCLSMYNRDLFMK